LPNKTSLIPDLILFSLRFRIDKLDFPSSSKTMISHIWLPSLLIISISSSGKICIPVSPPPLTTYLSTPGGKKF
jgi:hypothetical protein